MSKLNDDHECRSTGRTCTIIVHLLISTGIPNSGSLHDANMYSLQPSQASSSCELWPSKLAHGILMALP